MLPDYIIYDELKKERERSRKERPRVDIKKPISYGPDSEFEAPENEEDEEGSNRGVEIIQI